VPRCFGGSAVKLLNARTVSAKLIFLLALRTLTMQIYYLSILAILGAVVSAAPAPDLSARSITCLKVGAPATATWTNAAGKTCKWTGVVGTNFGTNSVNSGEYVLDACHRTLQS
jgi:hypothetical protein